VKQRQLTAITECYGISTTGVTQFTLFRQTKDRKLVSFNSNFKADYIVL